MASCEIRIQHHHFHFFRAPQSATSCHRGVILVTTLKSVKPFFLAWLNHPVKPFFFYFVFTTEARTKPKGPAATLGSTVWPDVASHRLWSHTELLSPSLLWVLDCCRCVCWGSPQALSALGEQCCARDWGTPAPPPGSAELGLCMVSGLGPVQLQLDWGLSTPWYLQCVWKCQSSWQKWAHSASRELSPYPLHTELEFRPCWPQDPSYLQDSNWVPLMPV